MLFALSMLAAPLACQAQAPASPWFTVTGNPRDPLVDTVQVDPIAVGTDGARKTMKVRVNRSRQRLNWDRLPYRSYESQVLFDCHERRASYQSATFYGGPLWQGEPLAAVDYSADPKPMLFLDVEPNPTQRLIRAACRALAG